MKFVVLATVASLFLATTPALAADPAPAAPPAVKPLAPPTPHMRELARRYIDDLHFERTMDMMMSNLTPALMNQIVQSEPDAAKVLTPEFTKALTEVVNEWAHDETPRMMEQMTDLTAQIYSEQELTDLIAFQESATGRSVQAKAPLFASHVGEMMKSMHPLTATQVLERVCKKVDCIKLFSPKPDLPDAAAKKS
jgi:hypothetical protein